MSNETIDYSDTTIIIPTLNEERTIGKLISQIEEYAPGSSIIVSDDGSKDNTKEIVESYKGKVNAFFLDRKESEIHGLTISVLDAILKCNTPFFLVMDGDLQHPPDSIPEFHVLLKQNYDLVTGKRIKVIGKWSIHRKLMSYIARILGIFSLALRRRNIIKDVMTGLFASKTEIWIPVIKEKKNKFTLEGYKVLFDFLKICKIKLKKSHVEYVFGTRDYGESKISKRVIWLYFKSLF